MLLANCPGEDCALSQATLPITYNQLYQQTLMAGLGCGPDCKNCGVPNQYPLALNGLGDLGSMKPFLLPALGAVVGGFFSHSTKGAIVGAVGGILVSFFVAAKS